MLIKAPNQKIKHRILFRAVVRAESELAEILPHVLPRDLDVCRGTRLLEQTPEAVDVVQVVRDAMAIIVIDVFLRTMRHRAVSEAVALK